MPTVTHCHSEGAAGGFSNSFTDTSAGKTEPKPALSHPRNRMSSASKKSVWISAALNGGTIWIPADPVLAQAGSGNDKDGGMFPYSRITILRRISFPPETRIIYAPVGREEKSRVMLRSPTVIVAGILFLTLPSRSKTIISTSRGRSLRSDTMHSPALGSGNTSIKNVSGASVWTEVLVTINGFEMDRHPLLSVTATVYEPDHMTSNDRPVSPGSIVPFSYHWYDFAESVLR